MKRHLIGSLAIAANLFLSNLAGSQALPPPDDTPEEVLRADIILEARSPLTGEPLTPAEFAELQTALRERPTPLVSSEIRKIIYLLQLRRLISPIIPLLP